LTPQPSGCVTNGLSSSGPTDCDRPPLTNPTHSCVSSERYPIDSARSRNPVDGE
jgi:hypothetical protein